VPPKHRNGIVIWYLLAMALREFATHDYLVTRTHLKANGSHAAEEAALEE
jgi:hypothetical protein